MSFHLVHNVKSTVFYQHILHLMMTPFLCRKAVRSTPMTARRTAQYSGHGTFAHARQLPPSYRQGPSIADVFTLLTHHILTVFVIFNENRSYQVRTGKIYNDLSGNHNACFSINRSHEVRRTYPNMLLLPEHVVHLLGENRRVFPLKVTMEILSVVTMLCVKTKCEISSTSLTLTHMPE